MSVRVSVSSSIKAFDNAITPDRAHLLKGRKSVGHGSGVYGCLAPRVLLWEDLREHLKTVPTIPRSQFGLPTNKQIGGGVLCVYLWLQFQINPNDWRTALIIPIAVNACPWG